MGNFRSALYGVLTIALGACQDPLVVANSNNPDRGRVFNSAADLEQCIASGYARAHAGTLGAATVLTGGSNDALQPQLLVMGMENVSALANFAMGPRSAIPRNPITNARGSQGNIGNYRDWVVQHSAARTAALGMARLKTFSLGSPARDARARAFGRFSQGVALGNLALAYDSASVLTENDNPEADAAVIVPLSGYRAVMSAALAYLDSAIAIASGPVPAGPAGDWFPLPSTWINGQALTSGATGSFVQLARSYKARFRAGGDPGAVHGRDTRPAVPPGRHPHRSERRYSAGNVHGDTLFPKPPGFRRSAGRPAGDFAVRLLPVTGVSRGQPHRDLPGHDG